MAHPSLKPSKISQTFVNTWYKNSPAVYCLYENIFLFTIRDLTEILLKPVYILCYYVITSDVLFQYLVVELLRKSPLSEHLQYLNVQSMFFSHCSYLQKVLGLCDALCMLSLQEYNKGTIDEFQNIASSISQATRGTLFFSSSSYRRLLEFDLFSPPLQAPRHLIKC